VVVDGKILEITNESLAYHPSRFGMLCLVKRLAEKGADLRGDGGGVVVTVYAVLDGNGVGKKGRRYRVANSPAGIKLVPE